MRHAILLFLLTIGLGFGFGRPADAEAFVRLTIEAGGATRVEASPGSGPETPFAIASVGKAMTAVAVLALVERGMLDPEDRVVDLLPSDLADRLDGATELRLSHLLTMTSGLPDYYTDDWLEAALEDPDGVQSVDGALAGLLGEAPLFPPGRGFDYSNTNYVLLGAILEAAVGRTYADILRAEVFEPAGMTDSFVFGSRPLPPGFAEGHEDRALVRRYYAGAGLADGGVISTARDVARFYRALVVDRRLLSEESLGVMLEDPMGEGYGMGIEIEEGIAGHSGGDLGYSSDVRIDLEDGHLAVELVAAEDADLDWPWEEVAER